MVSVEIEYFKLLGKTLPAPWRILKAAVREADVQATGDGEDINIKTTHEGIVIDVTFDGEIRRSAWLTWSDVYDLTH